MAATLLVSKRLTCIEYCQTINRIVGEREKKYQEILEIFKTTVESVQGIELLNRLYKNFKVVIKQMPDEIKKRSKIKSCLTPLQTQIASVYKCQIGKELETLQQQLKQAYDSTQLDQLYCRLSCVRKYSLVEWETEFDATFKKCEKIYLDKMDIVLFAEQHQIRMEIVQNTNTSSSSGHRIAGAGPSSPSIYPILSIDGGGIRGIIPATMLVEIEKIAQKPISSLFRLIGGTSTGGILALGLTKAIDDVTGQPQYKAEDLLKIYTQEHSSVFQNNPNYTTVPDGLSYIDQFRHVLKYPKYQTPLPLFNAKLSSSRLSSALTEIIVTGNGCAEMTEKMFQVAATGASFGLAFLSGMLGSNNPSYISLRSMNKTVHYFSKYGLNTVTYNLNDLGRLKRRSSHRSHESASEIPCTINLEYKSDFYMKFAAQVTSAAPTFFPSVDFDNSSLVDGGVLENSPAIPCILNALKNGSNRSDLFMVSLGTGMVVGQQFKGDLASSVMSNWFHLTQPDDDTHETIRDILNMGAYHRFQYYFPESAPDLDDHNLATISLLENAGKELVEDNIDRIRAICKFLNPESI